MNITVYSTETCPWCIKVKEYLRENKISFNEKDINLDRNAAIEMMSKSGQGGVPVLDIDGKIIVGFDKENIDKVLSLSSES
ncbi:glutaredoxin family protein [Clostridium algidicarnis]|uniref:Glutaredoxin-like YruB-family protein n=2 Tax=Clostridium algidicarnis TaxID=37659 RepID=A0A2S6G199_9CLOT|nr:glutaredoxin domain-containing protein [Clostridium algidicarnis]MBB6630496.1 glutathione S-transferase N-terminal domain-containing protein [Clostridium algidicarnis]MBB6696367.1 glutathione S-transferase N-terminal domain-containing protein [Clostridium algidicarnis]MBU3193586.1 glutathione S-transferase N-terminal domain-containing protein [Clostridium algidicarnis]MBU3205693.1 glutathione S-transferase N-terminal domain-containing protein [Clostridium algidicarnis]MBU3218597.1 glutathio